MKNGEQSRAGRILSAAAFYGGLWGIIEATLGFLFHLLPTIMPVPSISGAVLFPVGFFFMFAAFVSSGSTASILLAAVAATAVKLASLAVPGITFLFIRNPAMAILLEGLVTFGAATAFGLERGKLLAVKALGLAVTWRVLFLFVSLVAGIRGGILAKGTGAILEFLLLESAINAVLIWLVVSFRLVERTLAGVRSARSIPVAASVLAMAGGLGAQVVFQLI